MIGIKKLKNNFLFCFRYSAKNSITVCTNQAHQAARENVDNKIIQYNHHRIIQFFVPFLYKTNIKNNGQNATKKNQRLIGLSNKN